MVSICLYSLLCCLETPSLANGHHRAVVAKVHAVLRGRGTGKGQRASGGGGEEGRRQKTRLGCTIVLSFLHVKVLL